MSLVASEINWTCLDSFNADSFYIKIGYNILNATMCQNNERSY